MNAIAHRKVPKLISYFKLALDATGCFCCSSLDRTFEQRRDNLALEQYEDDEGGEQDQDRASTQQGDISRVVALERAQRTSHRSLRRVFDEHQRKEKLVPCI